ncbi:MAG TPA: hypothetical protein VH475_14145, partial [Tepidisphaeraceae bacterium]
MRLKRAILLVSWGVKGVLLAVCVAALAAWPMMYSQGRTITYYRLRSDGSPARYRGFQVGCFRGVTGVWFATGQVITNENAGRTLWQRL